MGFYRNKFNTRSSKILLSKILVLFALCLTIVGISKSLYDWQTNQLMSRQAALLQSEANSGVTHIVPSTTKITPSTVVKYTVPPTLPRYLIIPKLGVNARVLSVGVNYQGALQTPNNVYDTDWYNLSAMPGQLGAMLIDGHISSWTTKGVFYGLKSLVAGDVIEVQGGNSTVFSYSVVKTQIYSSSNVDMSAAMVSIDPNKPGLNLISCTGDVIPGTNDFNERIIVFSTLE